MKSQIRKVNGLFFTILLLLFSSIGRFCFAQYQQVVFDHITTNDGLSQSTVNCIIQDRKGFLWFGTYDGLNKYDGITFKVYRNNDKDRTSISSNDINALLEDKQGYIWIANGSRTGLDRFNPENETFENYRHDPADPQSISSNRVYSIFQDRKGNIWICTENALNLYIPPESAKDEKARFEKFTYPGSSDPFTWVYENSKGQMLLFSEYLYYFNPEKKEIVSSGIPVGNIVRNVVEDEKNSILVGTSTNGIVKLLYDEVTKKYRKVNAGKINVTPANRNCLFIDHHKHIWIGTEVEGLYRYKPENDVLEHFESNEFDHTTMNGNTIYSIYEDKSGVMWFGTFSYGINKIDFYRKQILHFRKIPHKENSLSGDIVSSIHGIHPDEAWVGLDVGGGVNRIIFSKDQEPRIIHYSYNPDDPNTIGGNSTISLVQRKNGEVWVGSSGGVISRIKPEPAFSMQKPVVKRYQFEKWTFALYEDSEGILWGGTWENGLWRYNDKTDQFDFFTPDPNNKYSICDDIIWSIGEDQYKNIWIGGHGNGISILTADEKRKKVPRFINTSNEPNNPQSISNNTINAICKAHDGTLWIGTAGGLNKVLNHQKIRGTFKDFPRIIFKSYTTEGIPSKGIDGIVEDQEGNIWLSSINGFARMDPETEKISEGHCFKSNEYWHNAYFKNKNGMIFFGGQNGLDAFYPEQILPNPFLPKVVITDLLLFNKTVQVGDTLNNQVVLHKSISELSEIILSYKNNMISFHFAALHFAQPTQNEYAYYLEGLEKKWNYIGNKREAGYTNLDPGKYIFRVKAANNDGIWDEKGIALKIIIRPPWWKTLLFKICTILFLISIAGGYYFYRINLLKKQKKILEIQVKKRTKEVEDKNVLLQQNSEQLNEVNTLLEERQQYIEEQAEEIRLNNEWLTAANENMKQQSFLLEETNKELAMSNNTKDRLFSIIAHDLKNPFNSIMNFAEVLHKKYHEITEERRIRFIDAIYESSSSIYELLDKLLKWSRMQTRTIGYVPEEYDIIDQLDEILLLNNHILEQKEIIVKKDINGSRTVFADRYMLDTVLRNLIGNAVKYTEKGNIEISVSIKGDFSQISIADTGIGISEEKLPDIFNIDSKKTLPGTRGEKGSGLGLVICRDFIQANGGTISVESKKGRGTVITFTLPCSKSGFIW